MMELPIIMLTLGGLFLLGLAADLVGRHSVVPRVTLLMLGGIVVGEAGLGVLPEEANGWYDFLSVTALTMVAFLLGASLSTERLRANGRAILWVSGAIVVITTAFVAGGLFLIGTDPILAVLLGAIATATAPAATIDAVRNSGVRNRFTETVEGIVAIDDAWGLIVFALALTVGHALMGVAGGAAIGVALWEIGGAVALGLAIGIPAAYGTGRIRDGEPLQAEALAIVFLTAGAALWLEVSFLIAGMTAGAIIVNTAAHHERSFHEIEHMEWPFMLLFFVLAGASLKIDALTAAGALGAAYCVLRTVSRFAGGWTGAVLARVPPHERQLYGPALLPQAGVAVGMALVASREFPDYGQIILTVTIASTVVFELFGPIGTRWSCKKSAETAGRPEDAAA